MNITYMDCFSGISGDMLLGALVDAGMPLEELKSFIDKLAIEPLDIQVEQVKRNGVAGTKVSVLMKRVPQKERNIKDIFELIDRSSIPESIKEKGKQVFMILATAEASVHACKPEDVHFHEIGAVDSIVDILGSVFGIESLGLSRIFCSQLPVGEGFVDSRHGIIPVPAPATVEILKGIPVYGSGIKTELITPTGAALIKALVDEFCTMPPMIVEKVAYGAGSKEIQERPNLLRLFIGKETCDSNLETVLILETNLDDVQPEWMGYLMERLFDEGALDVTFTPIQMKKDRPGVMLQVISRPQDMETMMGEIFNETTTLGIRFTYSFRRILPRTREIIDSPWGKIQVKKVTRPNGSTWIIPEFEVCKVIAKEQGIPIRDIYSWIHTLNSNKLRGD